MIRLVLLVAVFFTQGCNDDPASSNTALRIARVSGNNQTGPLGSFLASPLVVLVTDRIGQPVANQRIDFAVVEGGGILAIESALSEATGLASTRLRLGPEPGTVRIKAQVFGTEEAVFFEAAVTTGVDSTATSPGGTPASTHPFPGGVLRTHGNGHVAVRDSPSLYLSQQFTVELWFRVEHLKAGNVFGWNQLLANNEYEIAVDAQSSRITTCCYDGRSLTSLLDGLTSIALGRWYHLALINDGSTQRILLNGALDSIIGTVKQHDDQKIDLWFGNDPDADRAFDGFIDEVRIWTRPLGAEEIQRYINQGRSGTEEGLVGYWTFDAPDLQGHIPDLSGHGNDGTLVGDAEIAVVQ